MNMQTNVRTRKVFAQIVVVLVLIAAMVGQVSGVSAASSNPKYEYYVIGDPGDVVATTSGGLLLMGGGTDVDDGFRWMINKSGNGDFVVIRASGTDAYNPWIYYDLGNVNSAETIIIQNRAAASDPFVLERIRNADALFIAGGDQSNYVDYWKGTPVEDAIHELVAHNVPIGGTSAGLAIMGEFVFSAANGTIYSDTALKNPFNRKVALDRNFLVLPYMNGVITDSHFVTRDRMGRLLTFLARIVQDGWSAEAKGIGIDERTALAVESDGTATVMGSGAAYFLKTPGMPDVCQPKTPLTYLGIDVYRVSGSATFNFSTWIGTGGTSYQLDVDNGVVTSTQAGGSIY
jgi:cyanophycinase